MGEEELPDAPVRFEEELAAAQKNVAFYEAEDKKLAAQIARTANPAAKQVLRDLRDEIGDQWARAEKSEEQIKEQMAAVAAPVAAPVATPEKGS